MTLIDAGPRGIFTDVRRRRFPLDAGPRGTLRVTKPHITLVEPGPQSQVFEITALTAPWADDEVGATADQTASIQAQIAAIPDGVLGAPNIIRFPVGLSQGKYFTQGNLANNPRGIGGCVLFVNRHHLIIEGPSAANPATFYTVSPAVPYSAQVGLNQQSERRHFWFRGCTDITVRNLRVEGSNYKFATQLANGNPPFWLGGPDTGGTAQTRGYRDCWEAEHAFAFDGCNNVAFVDCQGSDIWGDGFYLGNYTTGATRNFLSDRCTFIGTGRQGFALSRCADVVIDHVQIGTSAIKPRRAVFDLEPVVDWVVERVEIKNFLTFPGNMAHIAALGSSRVDDINIHHGQFRGGGGQPVNVGASDGTRRKNWRIADVEWVGAFGSPSPAMQFRKVDGVLVENCIVAIGTTQARWGVLLINCLGDVIFRDNDWTGGCWIRYSVTYPYSVPQLLGFNTFSPTCSGSGLQQGNWS